MPICLSNELKFGKSSHTGVPMRIASIIAAVLVAVGLYALVTQRDAVSADAEGQAPSAGQQGSESGFAQNPQAADEIVHVVALRSSAQPVESGIVLRGQTEAARFVDVRSETSGLVISEPLRKGAFVTEGQEICKLDPGTRNASLAEANARLSEAEMNERATSRLAEEGYASETGRTAALAALRAATAAVDRAQQEILRLTMEAPFDGLLESDAAELGSLLQPGSLCARIIQLDPIKIVGFVPEADVDAIDVGNSAAARLVSGTEVSGEVTFISRSADPDTRTFRLEITADNADLSIRDGSTAEIFITSKSEEAHLVPQSALTLDDDGLLGIRAVEGDEAKFYSIDIVRDSLQGAWVTGLPDIVDLIVIGQEYVVDGSKVRVTYRNEQS